MCQALGLNPDETVWTLKELTDHWQIQKVRSSCTTGLSAREGNIGQDGGRKGAADTLQGGVCPVNTGDENIPGRKVCKGLEVSSSLFLEN